jgi:hypothetical protein
MSKIGIEPSAPCPTCGPKASYCEAHGCYDEETEHGVVTHSNMSECVFANDLLKVMRVVQTSPTREIVLAEHVALVANRNPHFDFRAFGVDTFSIDPSACCLLAIVAAEHSQSRIVGIAVLRSVMWIGTLRWCDFERSEWFEPALWCPTAAPNLESGQQSRNTMGLQFAWVAPAYRRRGILGKFVEVAAELYGHHPSRLPLVPPFTTEGRAALMRLFPNTVDLGDA